MKKKFKGITLVGMPGSGKSTVGEILAKKLGWNFVDLDVYIKEKTGRGHEVILDTDGEKSLLALEQKLTLGLAMNKVVFSPGGSIIYSPRAMKKLKKDTLIIYLKVSLPEIKKRLEGIIHGRGIVGFREKGISRLYKERTPVYEKCADLEINYSKVSPQSLASQIFSIIAETGMLKTKRDKSRPLHE